MLEAVELPVVAAEAVGVITIVLTATELVRTSVEAVESASTVTVSNRIEYMVEVKGVADADSEAEIEPAELLETADDADTSLDDVAVDEEDEEDEEGEAVTAGSLDKEAA